MTFVLPDPHDEDWSGCMIAYVAARAATLRRLEMVRTRLDRCDDVVTTAEKDGVDIEHDSDFRREMLDRLNCLSIIQQAERHYLIALRLYIELCRAVHGKIDRKRYDLITDLGRLGVPPHIARKMADDGAAVVGNEN